MNLTTLRNVKTLLEAFLSVTESKTIPATTPFTVTVDHAATYEIYGAGRFTFWKGWTGKQRLML